MITFIVSMKNLFSISRMGFAAFLLSLVFLSKPALAQSLVTLKIETNAPGPSIPTDFIGESFETASLLKNHAGVKGYLFDSTNTQLINIFKELGIKNLRIGGSSVDHSKIRPTYEDIDALFHFAKAAGVRVIYSLRLTNGDSTEEATVAKYIWKKYWDVLDCFAIGNETDWYSFRIEDPEIFEKEAGVSGSVYPSYLAKWRRFAETVLDSVPEAKFSGPDAGQNFPVPGAKNTGYNGKSWTTNFADDEKNSGIISFITQHNYVGQSTKVKTVQQVIDEMLSPNWIKINYPALYHESCVTALADGFPYRLTESNCFSEGINGGSNSFATALFALDYLHWWSEHDCLGVNFHTTQWRYNGTIFKDADGNYQVNPMAYGIKAFDIGGHGKVERVAISNPDSLNLTTYAIRDTDNLYVTIINKEYGTSARNTSVTIKTDGRPDDALLMYLTAPNHAVFATTGITLGGAAISNDEPWNGKWRRLESSEVNSYKVDVPASSAAIVKINLANPAR